MKIYKGIITSVLVLLISCKKESHYENGMSFYKNENYRQAIEEFKKVDIEDENFSNVKLILPRLDSLLKDKEFKERINDSVANEAIEREKLEKEIKRLANELNSIKSFNGKEYQNEVSSLTIEVALFLTWGKMGNEAKINSNKEISDLGKDIIKNLKQLQIKEFPKIRASFSRILDKKLWESDIDVSIYGKTKSTLQFVGGVFAANKNVKDFHSTIFQRFEDFRFKRVNYKWYKYDDEYTYYTIDSYEDSKIVNY
ncbi:hypothetical protein [uncultured Psychroserpens sp.]|uniref:hypothetical protein n=1 Tax=uncultured Psychroserpens sp. TaxID=255436 RepID=UPI00261328DD|nr:hypothetical protein [uncultured Psychroserpens sp.]